MTSTMRHDTSFVYSVLERNYFLDHSRILQILKMPDNPDWDERQASLIYRNIINRGYLNVYNQEDKDQLKMGS